MVVVKNFGSHHFEDYKFQVEQGGKFVYYQYCVSVLFYTFKSSSDIYLVRGNESAVFNGLGFTVVSLLAGWWGIPWGPIYTIQALIENLGGGVDVTEEVLADAEQELNVRNQYF